MYFRTQGEGEAYLVLILRMMKNLHNPSWKLLVESEGKRERRRTLRRRERERESRRGGKRSWRVTVAAYLFDDFEAGLDVLVLRLATIEKNVICF